jgi:hypothetical protein
LLGCCEADYCVLLSADDLLVPNALSRAIEVMEADPRIGMVYGHAHQFERNDELPEFPTSPHGVTRWAGSTWLEERCRAGYNVISSPEVVMRLSVQRTIGGYRTELPHSGDLEMWLKAAAVSDIAYIRGVPQACYRVHPQSMLRTNYNTALSDLRQRKAAFDFFFADYCTVLQRSSQLQRLANRSLAISALWSACSAYDSNQVKERSAEELVSFAFEAYPQSASLKAFAALRRRRRLGSLVCNRTQIFALPRLLRRGQRWLRKRKWKREGV